MTNLLQTVQYGERLIKSDMQVLNNASFQYTYMKISFDKLFCLDTVLMTSTTFLWHLWLDKYSASACCSLRSNVSMLHLP